MKRLIAVISVLLHPTLAGAQGTTTPTTGMTNTMGSLAANDFLIEFRQREGEEWVRITDFERQRFFNKARCECQTPIQVTVGFTSSGAAKKSTIKRGTIQLVIGTEACVSEVAARQNAKCEFLGDPIDLVGLARQGRISRETTVTHLFENAESGCEGTRRQENIWLFVDQNQDTEPDLKGTQAPKLAIELDSQPPPTPTGISVGAGHEALEVSWDGIEGLDDFLGYVILCSRGEDLPVFVPSPYEDEYQTRLTACPAVPPTSAALTVAGKAGVPTATAGAPSATADVAARLRVAVGDPRTVSQDGAASEKGLGPFFAPAHFEALNPAFLCSDLLTTQTSTRIAKLQNDIPYLVGVAAVDKYFNPSPIETVYLQNPIATRDFYTGYREAGGEAEGGFCAIGRANRSGFGVGGLALVALLTALSRQRRLARRKRCS